MKLNLIYWLCGICTACYALIYATLGFEPAAYLIAGLMFGAAVIIVWDWFRAAVEAASEGGREADAILAFSLLVLGIYGIHTRIIAMVKIALGFPSWLDTHWVSQFAGVELLVVFIGVVLATGRQHGGRIPDRGATRWVIIGFLAGVFVGLAVAFALWGTPPEEKPRPRLSGAFSSALPTLQCMDPARPVVVNAYCRRSQ